MIPNMTQYFRIGWEHQKQEHYEEAVKNYKLAIQSGHRGAKYHLNCMYYGQGIEYDPSQIVAWSDIQLNEDDITELLTFYGEYENPFIQNNTGLLYKVYKNDLETSIMWYQKAAQNYALAQTNLGNYYKDMGDYERGNMWHLLAANNGCYMAQNSMGKSYQNGDCVSQDNKEAYKWYQMSANQGYAHAQCNLGYLYLYGLGIDQDYEQAIVWFGLAMSQNNMRSYCYLGLMYENGWGFPQDYNIAKDLYLIAASNGEAFAYNSIGWLYEHGLGVSIDYEEASRWYLLGAEKNNQSAKNNLATLHYDLKICKDLGNHYNYEYAHKWYSSLDKDPTEIAHYNAGFFYQDTKTYYQDYATAIKYFTLSAKAGYQQSNEKLQFYNTLQEQIKTKLQTYSSQNHNEGISYLFFGNFLAFLNRELKPLNWNDPLIRPWVVECLSTHFRGLNSDFANSTVETWFEDLYG